MKSKKNPSSFRRTFRRLFKRGKDIQYPVSEPDTKTHGSVNEIDLLLDVLPAVGGLLSYIEQANAKANPQNYRRNLKLDYIGHALTATSVLEKHLETIQSLDEARLFMDDIVKLADCLESAFRGDIIRRAFIVVPREKYPQLHAIQELYQASLIDERPIQAAEQDLTFRSNEEWKVFSEQLASLTDQLQHVGHDVKNENINQDRATVLRRPPPELEEFIGHTFQVMTCVCQAQCVREMRLRLGTYKQKRTAESAVNVTVLTLEPEIKTWVEVRTHKENPSRPAPVQSRLLGQDECICRCYHGISRPQHWRLNIRLRQSKLDRWWPDQPRTYLSESLQTQVDLKSLIAGQGSTLLGISKMTLSVMLAYSLYYLYGGPWARGRWKRENIVFFVDGNQIPMRPFLKVPIQTQSHQSFHEELSSFHRYPEFLELGIMLLEINYGQSLEMMLGMTENIKSLDEYLAVASETYSTRQYDIEKPGLRHAIEVCLKPDFNMAFNPDGFPDEDELRNKLFEAVVQPLEQDLHNAFQEFISIDDLDHEASSKIRLLFNGNESESIPMAMAKAAVTTVNHRSILKPRVEHLIHKQPKTSTPFVNKILQKPKVDSPLPQGFQLFSNESMTAEIPSNARTKTNNWIRQFNGLRDTCISKEGVRLKVAILDTGIDLDHPSLFTHQARVHGCRSWVETSATQDISGHGTHIASVILDLTVNVDLYIAKVTESNRLEGTDQVAEVIQFASEEWDVDIISLSFGFPRGIRSIQKEIDRAERRNKIIFAAASNDGSNRARAFPANWGRVICIHSADGLGNRSAFNPTAMRNKDNFCVVGEEIEGAWPGGDVRRMSGTSFATPVGVAIVAFMIAFVTQRMTEDEDWLIEPKSSEGVQAMFRALVQDRDGYHVVNPVYSFSGGGDPKAKIFSDIQAELDR